MRLSRSLLSLRDLYNWLRAEKIRKYKEERKSISHTGLRALALEGRRQNLDLQTIHSQVVQNTADRLHIAFKNFFGGRARFPRFKRYNRYNSLTYPQSGFRLNPEKALYLSKLGYVRIFVHRPLLGTVRRLTIKREVNEWYAIFITRREAPTKKPLSEVPNERIRSADLGLSRFAVFDDSTSVDYPKYLRVSESKLRHIQHWFSRKLKGSKRRRELGLRLSKLHLHIKRQRDDWQNKVICQVFKDNDILMLEKLNVSGMLRNHALAKSISDASWSKFARKAIWKAKSSGKVTLFADPWGTTQFCNRCLSWVPKTLADREHLCPNCGAAIPRDLNSALLMKRLVLASSPAPDGSSSLAERGPLPSLRRLASPSKEAGSP